MQIGSLIERVKEFDQESLDRIEAFGVKVPPMHTPVLLIAWTVDVSKPNSYWLTIEGYDKDEYNNPVEFESYMFRELQPPMAQEIQSLLKESFSMPREFPEHA